MALRNVVAWPRNELHTQRGEARAARARVTTGAYASRTWARRYRRPHGAEVSQQMLYRRLIQHLGAEFKGLQDYGHAGTLVYFNDPRTGSTLALRVEELTAANIRKHLLESRSKFSGLRARTA